MCVCVCVCVCLSICLNLWVVKVGLENRNMVGNLVKNRILTREAKREWKTYYMKIGTPISYIHNSFTLPC